jgi:hypothetical protein
MSDVEHAGWAVGGPGSRLRRRRNPVLGVLAVVLLAGGAVLSAIGIVRLATEAGPADDRVIARGTVAALDARATAPATFSAAGGETVTVWLRAGGLSNVRETVVAGTECIVTGDGATARIRGSRQGTAVETENYATIGALRPPSGTNTISCRHVPFGRLRGRGRLRVQRPFVVERGSPADGLGGLWPLFGGVAAIVAGVPLALRWRAGSLRAA